MSDQVPEEPKHLCEVCKRETYQKLAQVTLWSGDQLVLVENVPVRICETCQEQYYDEDTGEKVLGLASAGFPKEFIVRQITVPVYKLPEELPIPGSLPPQSND